MKLRTKVIIGLIVFLVGGVIGRMSKNTPTQVKEVEIEKIVYVEQKNLRKEIRNVKHPDGSTEQVIIIEDRGSIDVVKDKEKKIETKYARTLFFAGAGISLQNSDQLVYNVGVVRDQVIGDFGVAGFITHKHYNNETTLNVALSYGF